MEEGWLAYLSIGTSMKDDQRDFNKLTHTTTQPVACILY